MDDTHTRIQCTMPPGVGTDLAWVVSVAQRASAPSTVKTSYRGPAVTGLIVTSALGVGAPGSGLVPTRGGATLTLLGTNFGAHPESVRVWWNGVPLSGVRVVGEHTALAVPTLEGEGQGVNVTVAVAGQVAEWAPAVRGAVAYAAPVVTGLAVRRGLGGPVMDCSRGRVDGRPLQAQIMVVGANFGLGNATVVTIDGTPCARLDVGHLELVCFTSLCFGGWRRLRPLGGCIARAHTRGGLPAGCLRFLVVLVSADVMGLW
jgi:hypothetical protein